MVGMKGHKTLTTMSLLGIFKYVKFSKCHVKNIFVNKKRSNKYTTLNIVFHGVSITIKKTCCKSICYIIFLLQNVRDFNNVNMTCSRVYPNNTV